MVSRLPVYKDIPTRVARWRLLCLFILVLSRIEEVLEVIQKRGCYHFKIKNDVEFINGKEVVKSLTAVLFEKRFKEGRRV